MSDETTTPVEEEIVAPATEETETPETPAETPETEATPAE